MSATYTPYLPGPWELLAEAQREELLYRELVRSTGGDDEEGALELAGVEEGDPLELAGEELEAMALRVLAEDGDASTEGSLYAQLEAMTPPGRRLADL